MTLRFHLPRFTYVELAICLAAAFEAVIYGFSYPYFSLVLDKQGLSEMLIGLNATLGTLGIVIAGPIFPKLILRYGYKTFVIASFICSMAIFAAIAVSQNVIGLFVFRTILGLTLAGLWISTEAWINHVVPDERRGFMNGLFQTLYSLGFAAGPAATYLTGFEGSSGAIFLFVIAVVALFFTLSAKGTRGVELEEGVRFDLGTILGAKGLLFAALLTGLAETAMYTLLPLFGTDSGLSEHAAVSVLFVYTIGEVAVTLPVSWAADYFDRLRILKLCALIGAIAVAVIALTAHGSFWLWVAAFIAGGTIVSLYNIALITLGQQFRGARLPVVSTAFSMFYALGCAGGATLSGVTMQILGPVGLPLFVGFALVFFLLVIQFMARHARLHNLTTS